MPRIIRERFNESEAENSITVSKNPVAAKDAKDAKDASFVGASAAGIAAGSAASAGVVRRRRGRRVTRGAGAAGEAMELKVEESSTKIFDSGVDSGDNNRTNVSTRTNSRDNNRAAARSNNVEGRSESNLGGRVYNNAESNVESNAESHTPSRPITSLLFQEPVLPAHVNSGNESERLRADSSDDSRADSHSSSRADSRSDSRSDSRANSRADARSDSQSDFEDESENSANERQSRRNNRNRNESSQKSQRSRRSRRLNAVERRAAAEVEQIEEDLAYDDIVYAPIDTKIDETLDVSDILDRDDSDDRSNRSDRSNRGNLRNRRNRSNSEDRNDIRDDNQDSNDDGQDDDQDAGLRRRRRIRDSSSSIFDEDDDEGMITRRRRRRRSSRENLDEVPQEDRDLIPDPEELRAQDEEETLYTRRRRRRRSKSSDDSAASSQSQSSQSSLSSSDDSFASSRLSSDDLSSRRSRKQQYIDEITDIEGSTRLEAKRQRRRDNRRERARQNLIMEQDFLARRENVDRLMVVRERDRHTQISVIEDNILVEHYVSDIQEVATVGNIYLGRIQNVLPSMEAAFVDIGQARNGVLYAGEVNWDMTRLEGQPRRIELAFKSGDPVLVQVTKDPIGHKGARLTSQVTLAGRFLVLVPSGGMTGVSRKLSDRERSRLRAIVSKIAPKDMGIIIRTAAEGASEEAIQKDLESLVKQWDRIEAKREEYLHGKRPKLLQGEPDVAIRVVRDIFNDDFQKLIVEGEGVHQRINEYLEMMAPDLLSKVEYWDPAEHEGKDIFDKWQIDSQLRKGMERQVYLQSGGSIVIDRTEAMTTIDVNTGRFIGRGKSLEETVTRCNLEASEEIARQLRLRDIGGMVMIDYVDMVMPANRDLVLRRLLECLARDRTKHQVAEVTSLGLVQMTRKRVGQGLVEAFSEECPTCKGRGFILHDEPTVSSEYADPYALKGGDPFVKTNKYGHGTSTVAPEPQKQQGSSAEVRAKLARIAAASAISESTESAGNSGNDENAENVESAESAENAEVIETKETANFAENAESTESVESTESAESTESVESTESAESTESVESSEPAKTEEYTEYTEYREPTEY
ncbi:ribonuclease G [Gardnerella vaginalis 6119V5]|uniref:Rne/Rng family ribonuclease n=1 Tax=Gardnerella vaginalis TaxID=2702 RepID=UPI0002634C9A|nr:Rne/Rng family ribonuclease [Gardnerella vaginalis]EIK88101.1 ribonuclease G [Gardnerella vaginalis 6119V5]